MSYLTEDEREQRRALLRLAAKGNVQARKELAQEYHARVYSAAQLAKYTPKVERVTLPAAIQRILDSMVDSEHHTA